MSFEESNEHQNHTAAAEVFFFTAKVFFFFFNSQIVIVNVSTVNTLFWHDGWYFFTTVFFFFAVSFFSAGTHFRCSQVALDVVISVMMVVVVWRYQGVPAALSQMPEKPNSVRYIIKVSSLQLMTVPCSSTTVELQFLSVVRGTAVVRL